MGSGVKAQYPAPRQCAASPPRGKSALAWAPVKRRPDLAPALRAFVLHVARSVPGFSHLKPNRILVVAGEARRASRATVRPLTFPGGKRVDPLGRKKPLVRVHGRRILYVITLRPLFFRDSTPRQRVATLLHELFHISKDFDGSLDHTRRHDEAGNGFEAAFTPVERRFWKRLPPHLLEPFTYDGEVRVQQWLEKPMSWMPGERVSHRSVYTEKHLFEGIVRMKTRKSQRVPPVH